MSTKHTPGQWRVEHSTNGKTYVTVPALGGYVAIVGARDDDGKANARLIAAAPELLAALEGVRTNPSIWTQLPDYQRDSIYAAIAKATGEPSASSLVNLSSCNP